MATVENVDYRLLMDTAVLAGEIMLRNGAETNLVEETIEKILKTQKMKHIEAVVMTTNITATMSDADINPITVVRRIKERDTNLSKIQLVHEISTQFCNGKIELTEAFHELKKIKKHKEYNKWLINISLMIIPPAFVIMLQGGWIDTVTALICGIILVLISKLGKKLQTNSFVINLNSTAIVSMIAIISNKLFQVNIDLVIIGTIMPLVPGVAITNATLDSLNGDYMSGIAKVLEAVIRAASIAVGVGLGIGIANLLLGGFAL